MKAKQILSYFILSFLPFFISCQKEKFQDEPFYCEIDGEVILANGGSGGWFGFDPIQSLYYPNKDKFGFLVFNEKDGDSRSIDFVAYPKKDSIAAFVFTDRTNSGNCIRYEMLTDSDLRVDFLKLDSLNGTVEMTFEGNLKNQCGEIVQVRKGRLKYYCFWQY
ncbi:MAG: hypothetical protein R2769_03780 [Saprospiraceae bacterium]